MVHSFHDKLALVTGASAGIGRAIAERLAEHGAHLALVGRDRDGLAELCDSLARDSTGRIAWFAFDLAKTEAVPELVGEVERHFGRRVELLVNAAGGAALGYVDEVPIDAVRECFDVNFFAAVALTHAVVPGMKAKCAGTIVNIGSAVAHRGLPAAFPYCASKAALHSFGESLRVELAPFGVTVTTVSPGPVDTAFYANQRVFGSPGEIFAPARKRDPRRVAESTVAAAAKGAAYLNLSRRGGLGRHLNYWAPSLFDRILRRKMRRAMPSGNRPEHAVDVHAYLDESRIDISAYVKLAERYGFGTIVLSAACTHHHEPDKSPFMYAVQRVMLKNPALRQIAGLISKSFYTPEGKLRDAWRLFTRKRSALNKVMHPDNDRVEELIRQAPERLRMWYWINPCDAIPLTTVEQKLNKRQIIGLKFHAYWHGFDVRSLKPYLKICENRKIPVYVILGFGRSGDYDYIIDNYPEVPVIFGYGGFPFFDAVWRKVKGAPNKFIDLASFHLDRSLIRGALTLLGPERCLYGSDCPYNFTNRNGEFDYDLTFDRLEFDFLSGPDRAAIYRGNFTALVAR